MTWDTRNRIEHDKKAKGIPSITMKRELKVTAVHKTSRATRWEGGGREEQPVWMGKTGQKAVFKKKKLNSCYTGTS